MNCVLMKDLRDAAKNETNVEAAKLMRKVADDIDDALWALDINADSDSLVKLNGLWAHGTRLLMVHNANLPTPPTGGAMPDLLKQAV